MKKTLAIVLTLTLVLALTSVSAFAAVDGTGTILFSASTTTPEITPPPGPAPGGGGEPPVVPPPTDPGDGGDLPEGPYPPGGPGDDPSTWKVSDQSIDFGSQTASTLTKTYYSLISGAAGKKMAGIYVNNETLSNYKVTVKMGGFTAKVDDVDTATMAGFTLRLQKQGVATTNGTPVQSTVTISGDNLATDIFTLPALSQVAGNWSGNLKVIGGSVKAAGTATATMTWTVVNAD